MMHFSVRPFRRLQWQLSLSYTLVAIGSLLVVELVLIGAFILALNTDFLPNLLVGTFRAQFSASLRPFLDRPTPDLNGLRQYLSSYLSAPVPGEETQVWTARESTQT